ncbi:hypothetical protein K438DRAFT_1997359 [Mycena galopus ATCC 62051]|nr:hypothetical protein K438DRAFT_1997359 [Mycena galopus ATCC 62051]
MSDDSFRHLPSSPSTAYSSGLEYEQSQHKQETRDAQDSAMSQEEAISADSYRLTHRLKRGLESPTDYDSKRKSPSAESAREGLGSPSRTPRPFEITSRAFLPNGPLDSQATSQEAVDALITNHRYANITSQDYIEQLDYRRKPVVLGDADEDVFEDNANHVELCLRCAQAEAERDEALAELSSTRSAYTELIAAKERAEEELARWRRAAVAAAPLGHLVLACPAKHGLSVFKPDVLPQPHPKLSDHIDTDSRPNKRKSRSSDAATDDSSKRLRSASVEPPPHPIIVSEVPPAADTERVEPPLDPAHKPIPKSLHFSKTISPMGDATQNTNRFQAIQGVTQLTNGQQYTTPPEGGFAIPQMVESPFRNTSDNTRNAWAATEGPKGFLRVYRAKYDPNPRELVQKLNFVIPRLVAAPALRISPPAVHEILSERLAAPWHFLISSIPKESLDTLTGQGVWSTPTVTFLVFPYDMPLPRYIMTLQNFTIFDEDEGLKFIRATILTKLKAIKGATEALAANAPSPEKASAAVDSLDTLEVKSLNIALPGGKSDTVWNIYFTPPPHLPLFNLMDWSTKVRTLTFETDHHGTGVPRQGALQLFCVGCKSYDHPAGLCSLPRTPSWFGDVPKSESADDSTLLKADEKAEKHAGSSGSKKGKTADGRVSKKPFSKSRRR